MTLISVYDCTHALVSTLPRDGFAYAGYVGHGLASIIWTPQDWASLPAGARTLTITAFADTDADILDYEPGNTHTPADAASWHARQTARGGIGCIYSDLADHASLVAAVGAFPWWAADPTGNPHLFPGSVATQWHWTPNWDASVFVEEIFWPSVPVPPFNDPFFYRHPIPQGRSTHAR
jgi:hypothetical protein